MRHGLAQQAAERLVAVGVEASRCLARRRLPAPGRLRGPRPERPGRGKARPPGHPAPGTPELERHLSSRLIAFDSFTVTVDADVLVSHRDHGGGYSLYVDDGRLHSAYNEYGALMRDEVFAGQKTMSDALREFTARVNNEVAYGSCAPYKGTAVPIKP